MNQSRECQIMTAPITINLELINGCNIKCRHCYNFWRDDKGYEYKKFSIEMFDQFLELAVESGVFHVVLTGGEPFTNFDVLEYGLKRLAENGISHSVNSNLMLATPEKIKRLRDAGLDHVLTSLNSYDPKTNDYMVNKKGAFEMIIKGIKTAIAEEIRISVNMIVSQPNLDHIYETGKFVADLGCQRLFGTRTVPNVNIDDPAQTDFKLDINDAKRAVNQLVMVQRDFGISVGTLVSYPLCLLGDLEKFKVFVGRGCPAQTGNRMSVNADGTAHACVHEERSYGNIFEIGIKGAFANMREWHDGSYLHKGCSGCDYINVCMSGCRMAAHSYSGKMQAADNLMPKDGKDAILTPYKMPVTNKLKALVDQGCGFIVPKNIRFREEEDFYVLNVRWANAFSIDTETALFLIKCQKQETSFTLNDFGNEKRKVLERLLMKNAIVTSDNDSLYEGESKIAGVSIDPFAMHS